jgi:DNA-directed RNA polymerase specialized sigma24 family protein/predicted GNAT family N-acyltransferase
MQRLKPQRYKQAEPVDIERLLKVHHTRLLAWGKNLTRGDVSEAQNIVQELCLYFLLKRPDLRDVENVEGYLYTCLRHIYLSSLARASRETAHFLSVADFDSFDFAITSKRSVDPLERQNDLRRICNFSIWRKERSKSASYFILHFFHGYSRQETAELACLPIAAIYNKLKSARSEIRSHLEESGILSILNREVPPAAPRSWTLLSAPDLFKELRDAILGARLRACLPEQDLLAYYTNRQSDPVPCPLLSHIVSCERCLDLIDHHFRRPGLADREPLDSIGFGREAPLVSTPKDPPGVHTFELLKRRWKQIYEHRPNTLSIAHNGKIIASHDVVSSHNSLSARIVDPGRDQFIEVFSEQNVRLALVSIDDMPPEGPARLEHRVSLSDSRWLELLVEFDGLGAQSQVIYHDEALTWDNAFVTEDDDVESVSAPVVPNATSAVRPRRSIPDVLGHIGRLLHALTLTPVLTWAFLLLLFFGGAGYLLLHRQTLPLNTTAILDRSIKVETAASRGTTEHQVLRVEEIAANGEKKQRGTIELRKDGDGSRYIRRLYDTRHRLVAAQWHNKNGTHSFVEERQNRSNDQNELLASDLWQQDLSAVEFRNLAGEESYVTTDNGYELKTVLPAKERPRFVSATLVLDKNFQPIEQTFEVRSKKRIFRLRLTQVSLERTASTSVADSEFDLTDPASGARVHLPTPSSAQSTAIYDRTGATIAELHIAALYQLYKLRADVGQPIELARTNDGRLRVFGSIGDPTVEQQVVRRLKDLENSELLDLRLNESINASAHHANQAESGDRYVYEIGETKPPIEPLLRDYLLSRNTADEKMASAIEQYSRDILLVSQHALQNAYALQRLGDVFATSDMGSVDIASRKRWTEMVVSHSTDLNEELRSLSDQLGPILPQFKDSSSSPGSPIEDGDQFLQVADLLLSRMQEVNRVLGGLFTSNATATNPATPSSLLEGGLKAIPLRQAGEVEQFASKLKASEKVQSKAPSE